MEIIEKMDNAVKVKDGDKEYWTLADILPNSDKPLEVLIIGKVPALLSRKPRTVLLEKAERIWLAEHRQTHIRRQCLVGKRLGHYGCCQRT